MNNILLLDWDSEFFKEAVGKIIGDFFIEKSNIADLKKEIDNKKVNILYYYQKLTYENLDVLIKNDFSLIDIEVDFVADLKKDSETNSEVVDFFTVKDKVDLVLLENQFVNLSVFSRFYKDRRFRESSANLYKKWFENSVSKKFCDYFFIILDGNIPKGFTTAKIIDSETVDLLLIFVDPKYRNEGIASKLINHNFGYFKKLNYKKCLSKTHLTNKPILNCYIKQGFKIQNIKQIFHYRK